MPFLDFTELSEKHTLRFSNFMVLLAVIKQVGEYGGVGDWN